MLRGMALSAAVLILPTFALAGTIEVEQASYGKNCAGAGIGNQTGVLAGECDGKISCPYSVNHNIIGDPFPHCAKSYEAIYSCGSGPIRSAYVGPEATGSTIRLDCE